MADLSKIKLNGTEYNLKDTEARNSIPTNISQLNNDIGFITSDEKVKQTQVSSNNTYIPILLGAGNMSTGNITASVSKDSSFWYNPQPGTLHARQLQLGNNKVVDKIPVNTSDLTNDSGFISSETDPTVPAWAKAETKPAYTAAEVGALPDTVVIPTDNIFIAIYNSTTYADTLAAYNAGKLIFAIVDNGGGNGKEVRPLTRFTGSNFQFEGYYLTGLTRRTFLTLASSGWSSSGTFGNVVSRTTEIASGDNLLIRDVDGSNTVKASTITFGSSTTQYLANNGTWQNAIQQSDVNSLIASAIGNINSFEVAIVTTLPTENIDTHTIYFMANNNNTYDEYMYINNNWELIGSSNIDLSGYLQTTDIADWAKAANKPTYTAAEVGALPDSTSIIRDLQYNSTQKALRMSKNGTMQDVITIATLKTELEVPTTASDIGALPSSTTYVSSFNGSTGAVTYTAPVTSVNGQTGEVSLTIPAATIVTQTLTSGTKIGEVNGTELFAPATITETDPIYSASPAATITTEKITAWDAKSNFSGSYNDLSDKPTIPTVPTNVSAFTNDSGYLTSFTETDPTVPAWAKAETKPAYTAAEVGAMATTHAANAITSTDISNWNSKTSNTGTVTSVRVQATSPVQSSTSTAQTTTLNTTISLANGYGDTKNPYGTKTANYVLAGPASGNAAVPSFRKLVAADIPAIGNITNAGDITTTATIASGDRLVINDESASKVTNSSITFGSSTTQYLANNGTWQNAYDDTALAARVTALENLEWATYYSGRSNPSNSQGQNGDIYLQY